ncbi:MAG: hypothetical protein WC289_03820 [Patescibacteria group bacterium]|jgi:hypothetical protein
MHHNLELKVQELVWNHKKNGIHVESFVFEPSAIEEEEMGNLYIIMQAYHEERQSSIAKKFHILASLFRREFYLRYKENPKDSFENTLRRMNITISEMKKAGEFHKVHLDFFIANIRGLDIQFTRSGNISAMLLRGDQLINMAKKIVRSRENPSSKKLFDTIATGTLKENDLLILSTVNLFHRVRMKAVQTLHSSLPFSDFMRHMHEYAKPPKTDSGESQESCALLFVKVAPEIEEQTNDLPSAIRKKYVPQQHTTTDEEAPRVALSPSRSSFYTIVARYVAFGFSYLWLLTKKVSKKSFEMLKKRKPILPDIEAYVPRAKNFHQHAAIFLKHYVGFVIIAIVIIAGIYYKFYSVNRSFQAQLITIQQEMAQASHLAETTQDRQQASDILAKAREKAKGILEYFAAKNDIKQDAKAIIDETLGIEDKIYGNRILPSLTPITDFKHALFSLSPKRIVADENTLVAIGNPLSLLYRYPMGEKEGSFSIVPIAPEKNTRLLAHKADSAYYVVDESNDLYLLDVRISSIALQNTVTAIKEKNATAIAAYGEGIYLLDTKENQIYKAVPGGKTTPWLKEKIDLASAVSLAVDGRIHVLTANGTVFVLKNGRVSTTVKLSFPQETFVRLAPQPDGGFIAIAASGRLYFFDNNWGFKYRLIAPQISSVEDVYVNTGSGMIYIVSGNTLYSSLLPSVGN